MTLLTVVLTIWWGHDLYRMRQDAALIQQNITQLHGAERSTRNAMRVPGAAADNPGRAIEDPVVIELEAQGVKLKMVNEATWNSIFKISFLWAALLLMLALYRVITAKFAREPQINTSKE